MPVFFGLDNWDERRVRKLLRDSEAFVLQSFLYRQRKKKEEEEKDDTVKVILKRLSGTVSTVSVISGPNIICSVL